MDRSTGKDASISGSIIKMAFEVYKSWYKKIEKNGLDKTESEEAMPLYESQIKWY